MLLITNGEKLGMMANRRTTNRWCRHNNSNNNNDDDDDNEVCNLPRGQETTPPS